MITVTKWAVAFGALIGIVTVYHRWFHVNPTTVALTLLLFILILAAYWGLRYAVVISVTATAIYNFFFLPPIDTFTVADPQNWLALFAFLATAIIASRLSERARNEASEARARQRELEVLLRLSREMLQTETVATLVSSVPAAVASVTTARFGMLYLLDGGQIYQAGADGISEVEIPHLHHLATTLSGAKREDDEMHVPIRTGAKPRGLLLLRSATLSVETAEAIGSLISLSLDRAQAVEGTAKEQAAKEAEQLRALIIDSITHELRTPLTSIKGAATALLGDAGTQQAERHELLSIIDEESDRLNRLVSEAVEMARLDARQIQMHLRLVNVFRLVANARETCKWVEDQHPIHVEVPEELEVRADPAMIEKVICNLLENAAKYSAAGTPIKISAEQRLKEVAISVADRGAGIEPTEQGLVFERFYRSRTHSNGIPGTGMGLPISRSIIVAHGGNISLTSELGRGSVFTMTLPAANENL